MGELLDLDVGDPDKTYEYLATQIDREDNLYQKRLTTCVAVNLGLGAAAASQVDTSPDLRSLSLILACSGVGYLVTRGIRFATRAGRAQVEYLKRCFAEIDERWPGRYPAPFHRDQLGTRSSPLARFTAITFAFEFIWIVAAVAITVAFLLRLD